MTIKVLGICGSPKREKSSSEFLLGKALDAAQALDDVETELLRLADHEILPCTGCDNCVRQKPCPEDAKDDVPAVLNKMENAHAIIFASPSYFATVPGLLKNLIDRSRTRKMLDHQLRDKIVERKTVILGDLIPLGARVDLPYPRPRLRIPRHHNRCATAVHDSLQLPCASPARAHDENAVIIFFDRLVSIAHLLERGPILRRLGRAICSRFILHRREPWSSKRGHPGKRGTPIGSPLAGTTFDDGHHR